MNMRNDVARKKWNDIYADEQAIDPQPAGVLTEYSHLLPATGVALDLACGLGGNALFLARRGFTVHAWDISERAIHLLTEFYGNSNVVLQTAVRDVQKHPPKEDCFDVICVSYFLERAITGDIIAALRPRGILFYQTFIHEKITVHGPKNPDYRLGENELLQLFAPLHVLAYQEQGCVGDVQQGIRDTACLVAQRR